MLLADWIVEHLMDLEPIAGLAAFGVSKHALGLLVVVVLLILTFVPFGAAVQRDIVPRGRWVNLLESVLLFIRDQVSRPFLGVEGDKFLPVLWTFFFFILYCNLLGLFPLLPAPVVGHDGHAHWTWSTVTPTGNILVTASLAVTAFVWWHGHGVARQGFIPYCKNLIPPGLPLPIIPLMIVIELASHVIRPVALAVRLWANMMAGHAVLYVVVGLAFLFGEGLKVLYVGPLVTIAAFAVYLLEIFVAFVQAYVFTFLVTVFLGAAVHPEH